MAERDAVAVSGVTGSLGRLVAERVADLDPVLLARDPTRAPEWAAKVRACEFGDSSMAESALRGINVLMFVSATESEDRRQVQRTLVNAASRSGVRHIVYTSFLGADPAATFTFARDHADTEEAIRESGMEFTFLRNNLYADLAPLLGGEAGVIRGPAGAGRLSPVARADVAAVAAAILQDPTTHAGATYQLTGPEAMTMAELAARTAAVVGRPIRFEDESLEEAYRWRRAEYDAEPWQLEGWVTTYLAVADGSTSLVSQDVERILGRPALTLEQTLAG